MSELLNVDGEEFPPHLDFNFRPFFITREELNQHRIVTALLCETKHFLRFATVCRFWEWPVFLTLLDHSFVTVSARCFAAQVQRRANKEYAIIRNNNAGVAEHVFVGMNKASA